MMPVSMTLVDNTRFRRLLTHCLTEAAGRIQRPGHLLILRRLCTNFYRAAAVQPRSSYEHLSVRLSVCLSVCLTVNGKVVGHSLAYLTVQNGWRGTS